jgi:hypothetical protein
VRADSIGRVRSSALKALASPGVSAEAPCVTVTYRCKQRCRKTAELESHTNFVAGMHMHRRSMQIHNTETGRKTAALGSCLSSREFSACPDHAKSETTAPQNSYATPRRPKIHASIVNNSLRTIVRTWRISRTLLLERMVMLWACVMPELASSARRCAQRRASCGNNHENKLLSTISKGEISAAQITDSELYELIRGSHEPPRK